MRNRILSLLAATAAVALATGASAADLPVRAAPPAPMLPVVPAFTWTGFYVGVNGGYAWQDDGDFRWGNSATGFYSVPTLGGGTASYELTNPNFGFGRDGNRDAFFVGGTVGYNFQLTPGTGFVFGVEADIQYLFGDNDRDGFFATGPTFYSVPATAAGLTGVGAGVAPVVGGAPGNLALFEQGGVLGRNGLDWFGTARLRAGYAFDRLLVYVTGGLAFADGGNGDAWGGVMTGANLPANFYVGPREAAAGSLVSSGTASFRNGDDWRVGWTIGGGVEWAFTNNISLKIEGLYVNLEGDNDNGVFRTGAAGVTNTGAPVSRADLGLFDRRGNDSEFAVVRGGLNFRFNTF